MSVVVLFFFLASVATALGLMVAMYAKDKPLYGAISIFVLSGPSTILAFLHLTVA